MYGYRVSAIRFDRDSNTFRIFGIPIEHTINKNTVKYIPDADLGNIISRTNFVIFPLITELEKRALSVFSKDLVAQFVEAGSYDESAEFGSLANFEYFKRAYAQVAIKNYSAINDMLDYETHNYWRSQNRKKYISRELADKNILILEYDRFFKYSQCHLSR